MTNDQKYHSLVIKLDRDLNDLLRAVHEFRQVKKRETIEQRDLDLMQDILSMVEQLKKRINP